MNSFIILDYIQRRINSLFFRLVLLGYAGIVLFLFPSIISLYYYGLYSIIYFILYTYLFDKEKSKLRLMNDFLFILIVTIYKDPNNSLISLFILLPIINSINHSSDNKSSLLYILTFFVYILNDLIYNPTTINFFSTDRLITPTIVIIILYIINYYTSRRLKLRHFRDNLLKIIEGFYMNKEFTEKPYKVYEAIIQSVNKEFNCDFIEFIICSKISNSTKLNIVNSSNFIWTFILLEENFVTKIRNEKVVYDSTFKIEEIESNNNISIYTKIEEIEYIYTFILKKRLKLYYRIIGFFNSLEPIFHKISNILYNENKLNMIRNEETSLLLAKKNYVNSAVDSMHFIRNRLTPLKNLTTVLEKYLKNVPNNNNPIYSLLDSNNSRSKIEIKDIIDRANYILEKSNNPFYFIEKKPCSIQKLFPIVRYNFKQYFPNSDIELIQESPNFRSMIMLNTDGFHVFLSDWVKNMFEYNNGISKCIFSYNDIELDIKFINNHKDSISKEAIHTLIKDLKSDDKIEILKRKTHGLNTIKITLEEMNLNFDVHYNTTNSCVTFEIKLPIINSYRDEDSNI